MYSTNLYFTIFFSTRDYHCYCEDGYTGFHCETDFDECWSDPCMNGATCFDQVADYNCSCSPGFSGKNFVNNITYFSGSAGFNVNISLREISPASAEFCVRVSSQISIYRFLGSFQVEISLQKL